MSNSRALGKKRAILAIGKQRSDQEQFFAQLPSHYRLTNSAPDVSQVHPNTPCLLEMIKPHKHTAFYEAPSNNNGGVHHPELHHLLKVPSQGREIEIAIHSAESNVYALQRHYYALRRDTLYDNVILFVNLAQTEDAILAELEEWVVNSLRLELELIVDAGNGFNIVPLDSHCRRIRSVTISIAGCHANEIEPAQLEVLTQKINTFLNNEFPDREIGFYVINPSDTQNKDTERLLHAIAQAVYRQQNPANSIFEFLDHKKICQALMEYDDARPWYQSEPAIVKTLKVCINDATKPNQESRVGKLLDELSRLAKLSPSRNQSSSEFRQFSLAITLLYAQIPEDKMQSVLLFLHDFFVQKGQLICTDRDMFKVLFTPRLLIIAEHAMQLRHLTPLRFHVLGKIENRGYLQLTQLINLTVREPEKRVSAIISAIVSYPAITYYPHKAILDTDVSEYDVHYFNCINILKQNNALTAETARILSKFGAKVNYSDLFASFRVLQSGVILLSALNINLLRFITSNPTFSKRKKLAEFIVALNTYQLLNEDACKTAIEFFKRAHHGPHGRKTLGELKKSLSEWRKNDAPLKEYFDLIMTSNNPFLMSKILLCLKRAQQLTPENKLILSTADIIYKLMPIFKKSLETNVIRDANSADIITYRDTLTHEMVTVNFWQRIPPRRLNDGTFWARLFELCRQENPIAAIVQFGNQILEEAEHLRPRQPLNRVVQQEKRGARSINTHSSNIHASASESATQLMNRYGSQITDLDTIIEEIGIWLKTIPDDHQHVTGKKGFYRITADNYAHTDHRSKVSTRELVVLFWVAIHDDALRVGPPQNGLDRLLEALYEIENEYLLDDDGKIIMQSDEDQATCLGGAFNKLVEMLETVHPDAVINRLTSEVATHDLIAKVDLVASNYIKEHATIAIIEQLLAAKEQEGITVIWKEIRADISEKLQECKSLFTRAEFEGFVDCGEIIHLKKLPLLQKTLQIKNAQLRSVAPTAGTSEAGLFAVTAVTTVSATNEDDSRPEADIVTQGMRNH